MVFESSAKKGEERRFVGISSSCDSVFAVGKIYIWGVSCTSVPASAIICILELSQASSALSHMALCTPCAVILSPAVVSARLLSFLICSKIPYLILKDKQILSQDNAGKIGLLDTKRSVLIIDPQLETLNLYPIRQSMQKALVPEDLFTYSFEKYTSKEKNGKSLLIDTSLLNHDELYDVLIDITESSYNISSTVIFSVPQNEREKESLCEMAEALFCAAVYGNFSIMFKGYRTANDIKKAMSCLHKAFCELEENGREFNGYIKRGLLLDSPFWLMRLPPLQKPDFICFDIDTLISRTFGCAVCEATNSEEIKKEFIKILTEYQRCITSSCRFSLKADKLSASSFLSSLIASMGIKEIYEK